jgi:hypothetical protein
MSNTTKIGSEPGSHPNSGQERQIESKREDSSDVALSGCCLIARGWWRDLGRIVRDAVHDTVLFVTEEQ